MTAEWKRGGAIFLKINAEGNDQLGSSYPNEHAAASMTKITAM